MTVHSWILHGRDSCGRMNHAHSQCRFKEAICHLQAMCRNTLEQIQTESTRGRPAEMRGTKWLNVVDEDEKNCLLFVIS